MGTIFGPRRGDVRNVGREWFRGRSQTRLVSLLVIKPPRCDVLTPLTGAFFILRLIPDGLRRGLSAYAPLGLFEVRLKQPMDSAVIVLRSFWG